MNFINPGLVFTIAFIAAYVFFISFMYQHHKLKVVSFCCGFLALVTFLVKYLF